MTEKKDFVGDPEAAAERGIVLLTQGDRMLVQYYDGTRQWEAAPAQLEAAATGLRVAVSAVPFEHRSERRFARLLDFYEIEWRYGYRTFELQDEGPARFTPDFYLPAFDLYIEIAAADETSHGRKQALVGALTDQYPNVTCKIVHERDYLNLLVKYGLEEVVERGTAGRDEQTAESEAVQASRADFTALIA